MSGSSSRSNGEAERAASTSWQLDEYRQRQRQRSELTATATASREGGTAEREEEEEEEASVEATTDPVSQAHAQTHNIADDLLPSPTLRSPPRAIPDVSHQVQAVMPPRQERRNRGIVFVNEVKNRTCWICSDGDQDEEDPTKQQPAQRRRWLHPCKCSLVAHESCLLTWIRTRRSSANGTPNQVITCPQCSHPYSIFEHKPLALILFEMGDSLLRMVVPVASAGVAGGAVLVAATAYGCAAMRLFMGKEATRRTLGGKWPWHFYFDIPLIPFALILSRLRILDRALTWLPTIVAFPLVHIPYVGAGTTFGGIVGAGSIGLYMPPPRPLYYSSGSRQTQAQQATSMRRKPWPPGPALTVLLVPWVRLLYINLKRRITRLVLSPLVRKPRRRPDARSAPQQQQQQQQPVAQDGQAVRRRRVIIVGQENHLVDANNGIGDVGIDQDGLPRELPPGADAVDEHNPPPQGFDEGEEEGNDEEEEMVRRGIMQQNQQTIYVSGQSLGRLCLGALAIPLVANGMGRVLKRATSWPGVGKWLAIALGVSSTTYATASSSSSTTREQADGAAGGGALSNLFFGGGGQGHVHEDADADADADEDDVWDPYGYPSPVDRYADLDPVWWRNALGAGLFIVCKDAAQLTYRYMRLNHARQGSKRTRILDRPFEGSMVDELELR